METLDGRQGVSGAVDYYTARVNSPEWCTRMAPHHAAREEEAKRQAGQDAVVSGDGEAGSTPLSVEPLAEVIKLPQPSNKEHGLVAVPLIRHWLFAPDSTTLRYRDFCVRTVHKDNEIIQRIRIGDRFAAPGTGYGVLKALHQRLLFTMQDLWQEQGGSLACVDGKRIAVVRGSSCDMEKRLFGSHGGRQQRTFRALVQQAVSIPVAIENYVGPDGELYDLDITGLIAGATFAKTRRGGQRGTPWVEIYLSSVVTKAFEASFIKPINLVALKSFRSDVTALLYPKFDYYLATNSETEMLLDGLVEKLGLSEKDLHQPRRQLRRFSSVADELNGQPLSKTDYVIDAKLVPAKGKGYKLVGRRKKAK